MRSLIRCDPRHPTVFEHGAYACLIALVAALLWLPACLGGDDSGTNDGPVTPDALVVVQETNLTICSEPHVYERPFTRTCDDKELNVSVCSAEPLCEAQIADSIAPLVECRAESDSYEASTDVECPAE